ncbi:hypothetical protein [Clostridium amazonitimonense]|uniref:hypothetical protein n=1 Tax=Clostridium amazonitimonense TaxID=1499689 RepID=UPI0005095072|nr:hypothetical protein [Clostridium amazonitimonense]
MQQATVNRQELFKFLRNMVNAIKNVFSKISDVIMKAITNSGTIALSKRIESQRDTTSQFEHTLGEKLREVYNVKRVASIPPIKEYEKLINLGNTISKLEAIKKRTKKARIRKKAHKRIKHLQSQSIKLTAKYL